MAFRRRCAERPSRTSDQPYWGAAQIAETEQNDQDAYDNSPRFHVCLDLWGFLIGLNKFFSPQSDLVKGTRANREANRTTAGKPHHVSRKLPLIDEDGLTQWLLSLRASTHLASGHEPSYDEQTNNKQESSDVVCAPFSECTTTPTPPDSCGTYKILPKKIRLCDRSWQKQNNVIVGSKRVPEHFIEILYGRFACMSGFTMVG